MNSPLPLPRHSAWQSTLAAFGLLMLFISLTMLPPLAVEWYYRDGAFAPFADSFMSMAATGAIFWLPFRRNPIENLRNRQSFIVVVTLWVMVSGLSALPFILAQNPQMSLTDAIFESVSGLTTTGATVLSNLEAMPKSILYYRAQLNFLGGMGIVVLAIAVLPMFGIGGMQLYRAETPGPMKDEKLTPRITETAKRLWQVYVVLTISCALAYWMAGMGKFDAIAHAFATLALGGFSTHSDSIGYFNSPSVEIAGGIFSLMAGINFALHFLAWRHRTLKPILRDPEFRFYVTFMVLLIMVTCYWLYASGTFNGPDSFYHGFFQAVSIATDNGLTAAGYPSAWPVPLGLLLIMASFFGGCVGSTCGGIKAMRFLLLGKQCLREMRLLIHPRALIAIRVGHRSMPGRVIEAIWGFYFLYVFVYCTISFAVAATGVDLVTAFGSVAACLNNMGAGFGDTASHFGMLHTSTKWLLVTAMLLGRLELFPLFILIMPSFYWD
jgi:trk system potassium uptake protein TrkH